MNGYCCPSVTETTERMSIPSRNAVTLDPKTSSKLFNEELFGMTELSRERERKLFDGYIERWNEEAAFINKHKQDVRNQAVARTSIRSPLDGVANKTKSGEYSVFCLDRKEEPKKLDLISFQRHVRYLILSRKMTLGEINEQFNSDRNTGIQMVKIIDFDRLMGLPVCMFSLNTRKHCEIDEDHVEIRPDGSERRVPFDLFPEFTYFYSYIDIFVKKHQPRFNEGFQFEKNREYFCIGRKIVGECGEFTVDNIFRNDKNYTRRLTGEFSSITTRPLNERQIKVLQNDQWAFINPML